MTQSTQPMAHIGELREVLQDADLRRRIEGAASLDEVTSLIEEAGRSRGYRFRKQWLHEVYVDVKFARGPDTLTDQELQELASARQGMWSAPKLCHTDSCGGHPDRCC